VAPSHALAFREGAAKRWQGYVRAGLLSREIPSSGCRRFVNGGRQYCWWRYRELLVGPARSGNLGTYGVFMRENREVSWSPAGGGDAPSGMVRGVACRRWVGREGNAEAVIPR
jgi:hypothetical protein